MLAIITWLHAFFISNAFFNSASVLLNILKTELQMLLSCYLIHISIIILRRYIYLLYLCPCLHLGLQLYLKVAVDKLFPCVLRTMQLISFVYISAPQIFRVILSPLFVSQEVVLLAFIS